MNKMLALSCLSFGAGLGTVVAFAADDADAVATSTRVFVRDSAITTKVKTKLAENHLTSLARIHVETDKDGVVWLTGTANTQEAIDEAVSVASAVEHVRSVHNDVTIRDVE
jgi:hyperosmotically inducible periplasmic protein